MGGADLSLWAYQQHWSISMLLWGMGLPNRAESCGLLFPQESHTVCSNCNAPMSTRFVEKQVHSFQRFCCKIQRLKGCHLQAPGPADLWLTSFNAYSSFTGHIVKHHSANFILKDLSFIYIPSLECYMQRIKEFPPETHHTLETSEEVMW